jgi:hypothetical protein
MGHHGPHVCPRCGERVTAFAAGCAICGAPLDPQRADRPRGLVERLRIRRRESPFARAPRGAS